MKYLAYGKDLPSNLNEMNSREKIKKKSCFGNQVSQLRMCWWEAHTAVCLLLGHNMSCLTCGLSPNRFAAEQELLMLLITHQKVVRDSHRLWVCRAVISFGLFPNWERGWVVGLRLSPPAEQSQAPVAVQSPTLPTATPTSRAGSAVHPCTRTSPSHKCGAGEGSASGRGWGGCWR